MLNIVRAIKFLSIGALALSAAAVNAASFASMAPRPPMGWNSWDAYGFTISEAQFKDNVNVLTSLKPFGWAYAVIDEGWYMGDPYGKTLAEKDYLLDGYGRLMPVKDRFPSAADGNGLKALADWVHSRGFKFGIHILRGIPKQAVEKNLPIEGTRFHAADAADREATCPWDEGNYGIADNEAGQAYYDSLMAQYAGWGVDFLKVDCISDHPYRPTDIRQIAAAIRKSGRPIVLSLSPGPTNISHADEVQRSAPMWRIADDFWDGWTFEHSDPNSEFPNGVRNMFDKLQTWAGHARPGSWPDADMLPLGSLRPHPGWQDPRQSRLTQDEARTMISLWAIARSPLILGGNLTELDPFSRSLIVNRDILALNQRSGTSRPTQPYGSGLDTLRTWVSTPNGSSHPDTIALFNIGDRPLQVDQPWVNLGLTGDSYATRDLWSGARSNAAKSSNVTIPAHGVVVLRLK